MTFLLDENFPKAAAKLIERSGYKCVDFRGTDLEGSDDDVLMVEAKKLRAVLLSTDKDFFHTHQYRYPDHDGIIVIALKQPNRAAIVSRLEWLLVRVSIGELRGRAFLLKDHNWVVRPPLQNKSADGQQ